MFATAFSRVSTARPVYLSVITRGRSSANRQIDLRSVRSSTFRKIFVLRSLSSISPIYSQTSTNSFSLHRSPSSKLRQIVSIEISFLFNPPTVVTAAQGFVFEFLQSHLTIAASLTGIRRQPTNLSHSKLHSSTFSAVHKSSRSRGRGSPSDTLIRYRDFRALLPSLSAIFHF